MPCPNQYILSPEKRKYPKIYKLGKIALILFFLSILLCAIFNIFIIKIVIPIIASLFFILEGISMILNEFTLEYRTSYASTVKEVYHKQHSKVNGIIYIIIGLVFLFATMVYLLTKI